MMGAATLKALRIIRDNEIERPGALARLMWPDSECWTHSHHCGPYGAAPGAMMPKVAGGFIGRLAAKGLVRWFPSPRRFTERVLELTAKGRLLLAGSAADSGRREDRCQHGCSTSTHCSVCDEERTLEQRAKVPLK